MKRKRWCVVIGNRYLSRGEGQLAWTYSRREADKNAKVFSGKVYDTDWFATHWHLVKSSEGGNINGESGQTAKEGK